MADFVVLATKCVDCGAIDAYGSSAPVTDWQWPKACKACGNIKARPCKDGELDNFAAAYEAQVAIQRVERQERR